jgi:polyhydroxybutyrate depolymerase
MDTLFRKPECLTKWLALAALTLFVIPACSLLPQGAGDAPPSNYDPALISETFQFEGVNRQALFYIPFPLGSKGAPVVFVLHGAGGTNERMMQTTTEGRWNELAFQEKFIVVYPQGWNRRWNDCRADITDPPTAQDDVGYLLFLLDWLAGEYSVDMERVYAAGHSNGGMMAFRLALEAPEVFRAVFSNNGPLAAQSECSQPHVPVSVAFLAGTADPLIPYAGGSVGLGDERLGTVLSAEDTLQTWLALNHLHAEPEVMDFRDRVKEDGSTVTRLAYEGEQSLVWFIRVDGGGHAWPGEEPFSQLERQTNGNKNRDINTADLAWEFFQLSMRVPAK